MIKTEQQRGTEHQCPQRRAVQQAALAAAQLAQKRQRRPQLQEQRKRAGQRSLLTQAKPENTRPLHRPRRGCPPRIEPQWNRQTGEDHAQRQAGFRQQQRPAPHQCPRQPHVDHAQCQGTERSGELQVLHQGELQSETHQWRAEQHRAIDVIAFARRPVQQRFTAVILGRVAHLQQLSSGKQQADGQVHQEEQNQKRLGAPQQLWRIRTQPPGEADTEGADKADQVQQAPGLEPRDGEDAGIE